jgi:ATP-binding cassette subfamily F protein 3
VARAAAPSRGAETKPRRSAPLTQAEGSARRSQRRAEAEDRNRKNRELRSFRDRVQKIEGAIAPLEVRLKEIDAQMASPDTWHEPGLGKRLGEEKKSIEIELAHLYDDWDHATSALQEEEARVLDSRPS